MGKIWQQAANEELTQGLAALQALYNTPGEAQSGAIAAALEDARAIADRQGLQHISRALTALAPELPKKGAPKEEARARIVKLLRGMQHNAQVRQVAAQDIGHEGRAVVAFPGFLTNDDQPGYILGTMRRVESQLEAGGVGNPVIYGWTHTGLRNLFNLAVYNTFPGSRSSRAGYDLAAAFILPRVTQHFSRDAASGRVSGTPLPLESARRNLAGLTFFGYSAGSIVAQETYNAARKMMRETGFGDEIAKDLLQDIVLIAAGNISRPSRERNRYTSLILAASNDRIMRAKNWIWGFAGVLKNIMTFSDYAWKKNRKGLAITPLSESSLFVTAAVRSSLYEWQYDENGQRSKKRYFEPLYPLWTMRRSYHELPHYVPQDDKNNQFSRIVSYALANAFNRTGRVSPRSLLEVPASAIHGVDMQQSYRARVASAMNGMSRTLARQNLKP